jgi:hypothetical protein
VRFQSTFQRNSPAHLVTISRERSPPMATNIQGSSHRSTLLFVPHAYLVRSTYPTEIKALTLLEYLVKNGSERVVDDARGHISTVKMLRSFHYTDEKGKDQGINGESRSHVKKDDSPQI